MSVSSNRKLNVEQLINLTQVYWDEPGKLQEISEAIEARMDPTAQLLFGAIANRLGHLQRDPLKALGEEAPNLAALIAARLGKPVPESDGSKDEPKSGAAPAPGTRTAKPSRKRVAPLALAGVAALLLAGAAWWWWPVKKEIEEAAVARQAGIEIQEQGVVAEEEERRGGARSALPAGRRRGEFPDPRDFDPLGRTERLAETQDAASRRGRLPPDVGGRDANEVEEAPAAARAAPTGGRAAPAGAGGGASPSPASAARGGQQPAPGNARPGGSTAGGGITMAEAQLECFLSDSRPNACAPPPGGGSGGGGTGAGGGGGGSGGGAAPVAGARSPAATAAGGPLPSSSSSSTPQRAQSSGGGSGAGGSGSGGAGAGGSESAGGGSPPARGRPAAGASAGGGGAAQSQQQRQPQRQQQPQNEPPPSDPDCPTAAPEGRVVFIFDGSISMGLPLGLDPAEEDRLDEGTRRRDPEARRQYRELLWEPGPKRMGRAQDAFAEASTDLPETIELGLVVFQECRDIRQVGIFDAGRRNNAIDYIRAMIPHGRTPLAQSLMVAQEMLADKPSSIVLLTDGREFCNGDPCAVAEHVKKTRPGTPIHIIDIAGQGRTECVAEITGGRSYSPAETEDLTKVIRAAFRGAAAHCPDVR